MSAATLSDTIALAHSALVDGRTQNPGFKHKQLFALFNLLQSHGSQLLQSLPASSPVELQHTLLAISALLETYPKTINKVARELFGLEDVIKAGGVRAVPKGVVVIVGNASHPFASWAIPLTQAIHEGNPAVILLPTTLATTLQILSTPFHLAMDSTSFLLTSHSTADLASVPSALLAGVVDQSPHATYSGPAQAISLPLGANAVIVDQSILPYNTIWTAVSSSAPPHPAVNLTAHAISQPFHYLPASSSALPTYLLIHENVLSLLLPTLNSLLPQNFQAVVQKPQALQDVLAAARPGGLDYLPVFSVASIDEAMDTVLNDQKEQGVACYIFAERRFGVYAAGNMKALMTAVNSIPLKALALGPYQSPADFSFTTARHFNIDASPSPSTSGPGNEDWQSIKAKQLYQPVGNRIDFFGGSFLFAGGTFATLVLGATGYGLYRGAKFAWKVYQAR